MSKLKILFSIRLRRTDRFDAASPPARTDSYIFANCSRAGWDNDVFRKLNAGSVLAVY